MKRITFICFCLWAVNGIQAQTPITLAGKVVDAQSQEALQYAQVRICEKSLATLSNEYGEFRFHIPPEYQSDSLCISFIGYQNQRLAISSLNPQEVLTIELQTADFSLEEVVIQGKQKKLSSKKIVRLALENLSNNYPQSSFLLKGYYRDYLKRGREYLNLMEVALSVFDQGMDSYDFKETRVKAHQIRFHPGYQTDLSWRKGYDDPNKRIPGAQMRTPTQNEFSILRVHDPIRNHDQESFSFVHVFAENFFPNHVFQKKQLTFSDGIPIYVIPFTYRNAGGATYNHDARGEISIRGDNFAITHLRYTNYFTYQDIPTQGKRYEVVVSYQEYENKMYLKYISMGNHFVMQSAQPLFRVDTTYILATKDILRVQFNIAPDERSASRTQNYDITFRGLPVEISEARMTGKREVSLDIPGLQRKVAGSSEGIIFAAPRLKSVHGYPLNFRQKESMYQYREFFTNEIITQGASVSFMEQSDKHRPFYRQDISQDPDFWKTYNYVLNQPLQE